MEKLIQHSKSDGFIFFINLVVKVDCPLTRQRIVHYNMASGYNTKILRGFAVTHLAH